VKAAQHLPYIVSVFTQQAEGGRRGDALAQGRRKPCMSSRVRRTLPAVETPTPNREACESAGLIEWQW
jgi:hypothetical protein